MSLISVARQWARALCLLFLFAPVWAATKPPPISTMLLFPWDFAQQPDITKSLRAVGINYVTMAVPWTDAEVSDGVFRFDKFDAQIDKLVRDGFGVILMLDFGGRAYFEDSGALTERTVVPAWYVASHLQTLSRDFSGNLTPQIQLTNPTARRYTSRFVENATRHFKQRHGNAILAFAIGLQEEFEIKLGQTGYAWRDYSPESLAAFRKQFNAEMPVINYNNEIGQAHPKIEPLLTSHRKFREAQVIDATCHYAGLIRAHNAKVIAYFGETFTSHDGIYATGAVEDLAKCLDYAVIDFNFYDGWGLTPSPYTLPMLASYLANSGYKQILVGAYGEQWVRRGKTTALLPTIRQTIESSLAIPEVVGYELGGFQVPRSANLSSAVDFDLMRQIKIAPPKAASDKSKSTRIGLFSSKSNFYFWHGERSHGRNIHQDALVEAYTTLSQTPDIAVSVFGEKLLREGAQTLLRQFDAVMVPHQAALPPEVKAQLKAYWEAGGVLIQDLRLGEFSDDGRPTDDWLHAVFGIKSIYWDQRPASFAYQGARRTVDMGGKSYANHAILEAQPGFELAAKLLPTPAHGWRAKLRLLRDWLLRRPVGGESNYGLIVRGERSLVFGFWPQLVQGTGEPFWKQAFVSEIKAAAARKAPGPASNGAPAKTGAVSAY